MAGSNLSKKVQRVGQGLPIALEAIIGMDKALTIIKYKIPQQELMMRGFSWDMRLLVDLDKRTREVQKYMALATNTRFPRALLEKYVDNLMLLGFSNDEDPASNAMFYLRSKQRIPGPNDETCQVWLVASKTKVAL